LPILNRKPEKESPSKHGKVKNKTITILEINRNLYDVKMHVSSG
jgi:hypothetical protein